MSLSKPLYLEEIPGAQSERVVLCVHGLNQRPAALKPLLTDLSKAGYKIYLLHLPGHNGDRNYHKMNASFYIEAYQKAYHYVTSQSKKKPYLLGYSFGGLLGVLNCDRLAFEKMVLLAPALQLRSHAYLLRFALPFFGRIKSVSLGNKDYEARYRYHLNGVPREIYQSFYSVYAELMAKDKSYLRDSKAIVLTNPSDELVSYPKLQQWVSAHTNWKLEEVSNRDALFKKYNHLCFDKTTLGGKSYASLLERVCEFLEPKALTSLEASGEDRAFASRSEGTRP